MFRFIVRSAATVAAILFAIVVLAIAPADAQEVYVSGPDHTVKHNVITFHTHVPGTNWTYVELRDGSEWMATPCRTEDSTACWWDACRRGNGEGTSFLAVRYGRHVEDRFYVRHACR